MFIICVETSDFGLNIFYETVQKGLPKILFFRSKQLFLSASQISKYSNHLNNTHFLYFKFPDIELPQVSIAPSRSDACTEKIIPNEWFTDLCSKSYETVILRSPGSRIWRAQLTHSSQNFMTHLKKIVRSVGASRAFSLLVHYAKWYINPIWAYRGCIPPSSRIPENRYKNPYHHKKSWWVFEYNKQAFFQSIRYFAYLATRYSSAAFYMAIKEARNLTTMSIFARLEVTQH